MRKSLFVLATLLTFQTFALAAIQEKSKESYVKKAEKDLQTISAKVVSLQSRAERAGTDTRTEFDRQLKTLQEKLEVARQKLDELRGSSEGSWKSLRRGADETLQDVKSAYAKAKSVLNKKEHREEKP